MYYNSACWNDTCKQLQLSLPTQYSGGTVQVYAARVILIMGEFRTSLLLEI
jgi:hypothetical protein